MEYKVKTLTKDGATMFAQADAQKQPVIIDKMVISDNKVDPNSDLTGLTIDDFTNNHEFDANNTTQNDTSFTVVAVMTNKGFTADYNVNLIGLLAHIGTDTANEKIIAIATGDDPFTLPQDTGTPVQLVPAFTTGFGTATSVTVTVSNEAYVLKSDLDNIFKVNLGSYTPTSELTDYISSNLPADVAKTDSENTFTKEQTFSAGAVNGAGKKALFDGDVDLSGTQPKGDYANNADLTALKNAVNSTSTGLPSKMATDDADKKYETSAHASSTYETQADANNKVDKTTDLIAGDNLILNTEHPSDNNLPQISNGHPSAHGMRTFEGNIVTLIAQNDNEELYHRFIYGSVAGTPIIPGKPYVIAMFVRSDSGLVAGIRCDYKTPTNDYKCSLPIKSFPLKSGTEWQLIWNTVTFPLDVTECFISIQGYKGNLNTMPPKGAKLQFMNPTICSGTVPKGYVPASADKVNVTDTDNWQKQAIFNPGSYTIDTTNTNIDFPTLLRTKYNKPGIFSIRDQAKDITINSVVISEGIGYWYATGVIPDGVTFCRSITPQKDSGWVRVAQQQEVQTAINQAHTDMEAEFVKRGNRTFWSGTQAQYDAIKTKDPHTEYEITG
ncbi:hypothetical protein IWT140_01696 [Secundilactobacillus pentosiphilus]|uniref:Minor tail protein gp31 C-terminal domain-containing protein n=1 Tax=Secundilactobacillus pentosiphilus TaxID=1714682 RepID=A0A1Z5IQP5_9LACO|nr:hypothetical protein [Secundilactobacillus pentosiphilus]GAX04059.1 hypothetical protein IWT140_01696 [Secundilactobacillus pentosiphilus]